MIKKNEIEETDILTCVRCGKKEEAPKVLEYVNSDPRLVKLQEIPCFCTECFRAVRVLKNKHRTTFRIEEAAYT